MIFFKIYKMPKMIKNPFFLTKHIIPL